MDPRTVVFLGPSLPRAEASHLLDADYHPPARMGDIYRMLSARVHRFVVIDGVFHGVPSVWHREILDALAEGVEVIGASSMGALRAAELHRFGMLGHGTVFEWYRDGVIDGDDEVALMHGDESSQFRAISDPLVNLRATFARLEGDGTIDVSERDAVTRWLKERHYPERSSRALAQAPPLAAWSASRRERFVEACEQRYVDVKRADARSVLTWCAEHPPVNGVRPHDTDRLMGSDPERDRYRPERVMWRIGRVLRGATTSARGSVLGDEIAELAPAAALRLGPVLAERAFLVAWARQQGVACPADAIDRERERWRRERRPASLADEEFLAASGLTAVRAEQLLVERALVRSVDNARAAIAEWARAHGISAEAEWIVAQGPAHFGLPFHAESALVEELRLTGEAFEVGV
jgi:hypothetical protein